jgi:hypothetical protein
MSNAERPGSRYWKLIEPFWIPLNESWDDDPRAFLALFRQVPVAVGHLYASHWCQSEVCNGGLHQFFYNTTGLVAPEALAGPSWLQSTRLVTAVAAHTVAIPIFSSPAPRRHGDEAVGWAFSWGRPRRFAHPAGVPVRRLPHIVIVLSEGRASPSAPCAPTRCPD